MESNNRDKKKSKRQTNQNRQNERKYMSNKVIKVANGQNKHECLLLYMTVLGSVYR